MIIKQSAGEKSSNITFLPSPIFLYQKEFSKMKRIALLFSALVLFLITGNAQEIPTFSPDDIDIPHQKFVLDNGLTLLVHEDHKAPIVAVNVWYHVGSKNEKPGKSGFASFI